MDNNKVNTVYEVAQKFKNDFENEFLKVVDVYSEIKTVEDGDFPQYELHVVIKDETDFDTYCYPVADFAREHGMYLFDTVTNWSEGTVTLRLGLE